MKGVVRAVLAASGQNPDAAQTTSVAADADQSPAGGVESAPGFSTGSGA